jgi:hypothetical protein
MYFLRRSRKGKTQHVFIPFISNLFNSFLREVKLDMLDTIHVTYFNSHIFFSFFEREKMTSLFVTCSVMPISHLVYQVLIRKKI